MLGQKGPCDRSPSAVARGAQQVASAIPGARVDTQNKQTVIRFAGNYDQTVRQLNNAGYYSGLLAFDPIYHSGGMEFRTWDSPGFHFNVLYAEQKGVPVSPNSPEFKAVKVNKPAVGTDLHIDCENPVAGLGDALIHGAKFIWHLIF